MNWRRTSIAGTAVITLLAVGLGYWQFSTRSEAARTPPRPGTDSVTGLPAAPEVQLVLIGATFCLGSDSPEFKAAILRVKANAEKILGQRGYAYSSVGVALDWAPSDGVKWLDRFGAFDQVMAGHNWLNEGAVKYIWRDLPGRPSIPALLIVERTVDITGRIAVGPERVLVRKEGGDSIIAFASDTTFAFLPAYVKQANPGQ